MSYLKYIKSLETAMPTKSLGKAKAMVEQRWKPLEEHLIKLSIWGDRVSWRREVYKFCKNIQDITLKIESRTFLTKQEYLEERTDFRKSTQEIKRLFAGNVASIGRRMTIPKLRDEETARYIVHKIQIDLSELFSKGDGDNTLFIDEILDRYLK